MRWKILSLLLLPAALCLAAAPANDVIFRDSMLPVLKASCVSCHAGATPAGGLNVNELAGVLSGGKHGPAIVPAHSSDSLIVQYIRGQRTPKMPMAGSVSESAVATLVAAIDQMQPAAQKPKNAYAEWLLHKPAAPAVPAVHQSDWVRNPVDAFVLAKLEEKGLAPAPPASPRALIRRVYFDLIGLPPTPDEIRQFTADPSQQAYEKIIDKLLADSRYGERWARHWLDLVRFAESDGFAIDGERPTAWRYRDYVIRGFNKDKPYDLFIKEQLAGDEMNDKRSPAEDRSERLVALGFMRMGTWEADANFKTQLRQDVLNDITGTTAQVFLGLTVGCARCHNHKYDPIPQRDFYRMQAFFGAMRVEDRPAAFIESEHPKLMKQLARRYEDDAEIAADEFKKVEAELKKKAPKDFAKVIKDHKDPAFTEEERKRYETARDHARQLTDAAPRYRPVAYSISDVVPPQVSAIADTYVLAGGELASKAEKVEPGFPECITGNGDPAKIPFAGGSSGRREALANWIASEDNPVTARVMVNRIWQHHFGEGIVGTPSDFGMNGERPTNPQLLDWLATQFVDKKWSIKAMHKIMLLSNTYQQSTADPLPERYVRWQRLEAEVVRDSILSVSGRLQKSDGGPGVFLNIPEDVAEGFEFFKWFPSDEKDQLRRTIYTFQRRSVMLPMVEVFDGANMNESCSRRNVTTVAPQAFSLLNGELTNREAKYFAARVIEEVGPDKPKQVERAFWLALGREPSAQEKTTAAALPLEQLGVVLFNLNEFVYLE
jgi:hypothetical protein